MERHVLVVGGGFSGTMLAVHLAASGHRATVIDRGAEPARGLAYGAADPLHLLNVRAGNMSALPDAPSHFADWLAARALGDPAIFAPRRVYGTYLQELFAAAEAKGTVERIHGDVQDLAPCGGGWEVRLADKRTIAGDAAALALGNAPPQPPRGVDPAVLPPGTYVGDPWSPGIARGLEPHDQVLVIGTGLTMVDIVLLLRAEGFSGSILALSRRGLVPRAHAAGAPPIPLKQPPSGVAATLLHGVRASAQATDWRAAVDALRPVTQQLWRDASPRRRAQFLRHLRPWWDVHRHRIAPEIDRQLQAMIAGGQLRVAAAKIARIGADAAGVTVSWRPRGSDALQEGRFARIINCTGPEANLRSTADPLLHRLLAQGLIRPDPLGIGVDVDTSSRALTADGAPHANLFALGPLTRGAFWEIVAVPDIRRQAQDVATSIGRG